MGKAVVFAGTTEGYSLCRFLQKYQVTVCTCTATGYGAEALTEDSFLSVHTGGMDEREMEAFLAETGPDLVIDATHPYAVEATKNIRAACRAAGTEYLRVLRAGSGGDADGQTVFVKDIAGAAAYLKEREGNILLTTGSRTLPAFLQEKTLIGRTFARVLPLPEILAGCLELGLPARNLIGMQGPFTEECNKAMLRQYSCRYLVTKEAGAAGGFPEKAAAAREAGATLVVIGRPAETEGVSVTEARRILAKRFGLSLIPEITVLGIGPGSPSQMTQEAAEAVEASELLIGARRVVDAVKRPGQAFFYEYDAEKIRDLVLANLHYLRICIVFSGDIGFHSGARKVLLQLPGKVRVLPGLSSLSCFMAKLQKPWDDAVLTSLHGKEEDLLTLVRHNRKVFSLLGRAEDVRTTASLLTENGLGEVRMYIGERLSAPEEKLLCCRAAGLLAYQGDPLSVVLFENDFPEKKKAVPGIPDACFLRGRVPMTREEIRVLALSRFFLREDSVCYDIGAGTGSVSVEMALMAPKGKVYAIERKEEALELLEKNRRRFGCRNLTIVPAEAPDVPEDLPVPDCVFIGGTGGRLKEILSYILQKAPDAQIVLTCITLETLARTQELIREYGFDDAGILQIGVSRSQKAGPYHMMRGEDPVYIITMTKRRVPECGFPD